MEALSNGEVKTSLIIEDDNDFVFINPADERIVQNITPLLASSHTSCYSDITEKEVEEFVCLPSKYQLTLSRIKQFFENEKTFKNEIKNMISPDFDKKRILNLIEIFKKNPKCQNEIKKLKAQISYFEQNDDFWGKFRFDDDIFNFYKFGIYAELFDLFQQIFDRHPYSNNFSSAYKKELSRYGFDAINHKMRTNENWVIFPVFGPKIPEEMRNIEFNIGASKANYVQLEFGIHPIRHDLDGKKIEDKLKQDLKEYKKAIRAGDLFIPKEDTLLFKEYKIHLMPKPEKTFECVEKLLEAFSKDIHIQDHLHRFKVITDPFHEDTDESPQLPRIVIYPKFGQEHAQAVYDFIWNVFGSSIQEFASHQTPRMNSPQPNGLIYYAQGDFIRKDALVEKDPEIARQMFNNDYSLYRSENDEYALKPPVTIRTASEITNLTDSIIQDYFT